MLDQDINYSFLQRHVPFLKRMRKAREEMYSYAAEHTSEPFVTGFRRVSLSEAMFAHTPLVFLLRKWRVDEHYRWGLEMERTASRRLNRR